MGSADIVPGVSGGTVALILGIYRTLINTIRDGAGVLKLAVTGDIKGALEAFKAIDWWFILPLGVGVITALAALRGPMKGLLEDRPEGIAAVFTGFVIASCVLVWRAISERDATRLAVMAGVAVLAFWLLGYQSGALEAPGLIVFFLVGSVAICAMILPGISGSFILLMFGMYGAVLGGEVLQLAVFGVGAIIGLALFSSVLNWLLDSFEQTVMAALLGLMIGSIRVLWPWPNGVGVISDDAAEGVKGTDLLWPSGSQLAGGLALASVAAVATLVLVHFSQAGGQSQKDRID